MPDDESASAATPCTALLVSAGSALRSANAQGDIPQASRAAQRAMPDTRRDLLIGC